MKGKVCRTKSVANKEWDNLNFSQEKIAGFDLKTYQNSEILLIGAGAIGSHVSFALVRKGIKSIDIFDDDKVELKNLTRQLFDVKNVGRNKAMCLAKILSRQGFFKSTITGYPYRFQEALEMGMDLTKYHAVICGVDNNPTRVSVARYCLAHDIPLITCAVSRDGVSMCVTVQEPGKACFGCLMPYAVNDDRYPCDLPGIIDVIQATSGISSYALDTVLTGRHREWNLRMIALDGSVPESSLSIGKKDDCPLCGKHVREDASRS